MAERKQRGTAGDKTICLPIAAGIDYDQLVEDREAYPAPIPNLRRIGISRSFR